MTEHKAFKVILLVTISFFVVLLSIGIISAQNIDKSMKKGTPDRILIQNNVTTKQNEMPAVGFLHDLHTKALKGDCASCHIEKDKKFIFKFKRTAETPSMEFFHDNCISCHMEKKLENKQTGPDAAQCRICHTGDKAESSSFEKINFSRSLHFIHESSEQIKGITVNEETNCSRCHHKYNEKSKEIFYVKGEEEACIYCHKQERQNEIRPVREASHDSCVSCHQNLKGQSIKTGPVNCEGCHDIEMQKKINTVENIPRVKRNQPDLIALTGWTKDDPKAKSFMNAVPFDHKAHESATETCKTCHHNAIQKCNDCHSTDGGKEKGGFIGLETAMHKPDSRRSCIGCHNEAVKKSDCAGCHFIMKANKSDQDSCKSCHIIKTESIKISDKADSEQPTDQIELVNNIVLERSAAYKTVQDDNIPEFVNIDILANEYKACKFPHRKVFRALSQRVENSTMAKAFHGDEAGLCMGCHHNSPKSYEPPKCASCHSRAGTGKDGRPGLKGAYHGQCITCHQQIKLETIAATDCVTCHEKK